MGLTHDGKSPILMENNMNIDKIKTFADGCYSEIQLVSEYMKQRIPLIDGVIKNPSTPYRDDCLKGLFLRANAWIQTLVKLNQVNDFQAICAANRALLEITVDIYLLHLDKTDNSGQMMYWWMQSEKIKSAEKILEYFRLSLSPPSRPKLSKDKVDFSGFWMRGGGGKTFSKGVPLPMSPISFFLCRKDLAPS
jgi:hypothetical protein